MDANDRLKQFRETGRQWCFHLSKTELKRAHDEEADRIRVSLSSGAVKLNESIGQPFKVDFSGDTLSLLHVPTTRVIAQAKIDLSETGKLSMMCEGSGWSYQLHKSSDGTFLWFNWDRHYNISQLSQLWLENLVKVAEGRLWGELGVSREKDP